MLSEKYKTAISKYAKKYDVGTVILFGSCLYSDAPNDIDIGIKGIDPENFFKFYGELLLEIPERIDVYFTPPQLALFQTSETVM